MSHTTSCQAKVILKVCSCYLYLIPLLREVLIECMGMKRACVTETKLFVNWKKLFIMFQRIKTSINAASQDAINKHDAFKSCNRISFIC